MIVITGNIQKAWTIWGNLFDVVTAYHKIIHYINSMIDCWPCFWPDQAVDKYMVQSRNLKHDRPQKLVAQIDRQTHGLVMLRFRSILG